MYKRGYNQYKEQSVNSMTPAELLLLLYDELVKRINLADLMLKKEDHANFELAMDRSLAIMRYLDETLDKSAPVSREIAQMYEYIIYTMGRIRIGRNQALLDHIKPMIIDFRDTFRQAEKLSHDPAAQGKGSNTQEADSVEAVAETEPQAIAEESAEATMPPVSPS